jgi:hypothetical protein
MDLNLNSHSSHHQAQGGASSVCVGVPPPQYATVNIQWASPHAAAPAPSGSNLSSLYTLPTLNKAFKRMYHALFH